MTGSGHRERRTTGAEASWRLSGREAGHLREALGQMQLLLRTADVDLALVHLVNMLCHLRAMEAARS